MTYLCHTDVAALLGFCGPIFSFESNR